MDYAFRGAEFLYILHLASGQTLLAYAVDKWIDIRAELDHVITFVCEGEVSVAI